MNKKPQFFGWHRHAEIGTFPHLRSSKKERTSFAGSSR
jgi:hypothetical protein